MSESRSLPQPAASFTPEQTSDQALDQANKFVGKVGGQTCKLGVGVLRSTRMSERLFPALMERALNLPSSRLSEWLEEAQYERKGLDLEIEALQLLIRTQEQGEADSERKMRISDDDLLEMMAQVDCRLSPTPLREELEKRDVTLTTEGVRYRLRQLVEKGRLQVAGDGQYEFVLRTWTSPPATTTFPSDVPDAHQEWPWLRPCLGCGPLARVASAQERRWRETDEPAAYSTSVDHA